MYALIQNYKLATMIQNPCLITLMFGELESVIE